MSDTTAQPNTADVAALLADWRASRTAEVLLACGLRVTLKKVKLLDLAAQGRVPLPLHARVEALIDQSGPIRLSVAEFPDNAGVINLAVMAAVTWPPIADVPGDGVVGIEEIPVEDRLVIWNWAQQEVAPVATFLSGS